MFYFLECKKEIFKLSIVQMYSFSRVNENLAVGLHMSSRENHAIKLTKSQKIQEHSLKSLENSKTLLKRCISS